MDGGPVVVAFVAVPAAPPPPTTTKMTVEQSGENRAGPPSYLQPVGPADDEVFSPSRIIGC
jgi:hypothetical protein